MSYETYQQLLALVAGIGYFCGLIYGVFDKNGPFAENCLLERFAISSFGTGCIGAFIFAIVYSLLWAATRAIYFGLTGI